MPKIEYTLRPLEDLDEPIFVMAFKGLFDMGEAATGAVDWLSMTHQGKPAASIDPELLFDFQEVRPEVRLGANGQREILWPSNNIVTAKLEDGPDLVLLSGVEPNLRWRSFAATLNELIEVLGCSTVVTLGASLAMVPHTRSFPVRSSTGDAELASQLGIATPTYEGPTGLVGALHQFLSEYEVPAVSLSVSVPHYVPGSPSPKATAALLARLDKLFGIPTEHAGLADEIREWESRVHRALEDDEDVRTYVTDLENQSDAAPEIVVDSAEFASEIEDFLRERPDET